MTKDNNCKVHYNNCLNCNHSFFERLIHYSNHKTKMTLEQWRKMKHLDK